MRANFRVEIREGGVAWLVLDRAEKHNAFDEALIADLTAAFASLDRDAAVDCVVLAAEGASFSAGADLGWMKRAADRDRAGNFADAQALALLMRTLNGMGKPTLALVQGAAYGGGVGLVACCDIALAANTAKFALSEARLGLIPAVISPHVVAAIGPRQARRYFQTAEVFDAAEAKRIGLVHETVAPDQLLTRAAEILGALKKAAPGARQAAKLLVSEVAYRQVDDALSDLTAARIADIRTGEEAKEGLAAFFERRPPAWDTGRETGR